MKLSEKEMETRIGNFVLHVTYDEGVIPKEAAFEPWLRGLRLMKDYLSDPQKTPSEKIEALSALLERFLKEQESG